MLRITQLIKFCCALLLLSQLSWADSTQLIVPNASDPSPTAHYYYALLKLALDKTAPEYGNTELSYYPVTIGRERQRSLIATHAGLDVMWSSTNIAREKQLLAIRLNLLRELSDYKLLLIRTEDQQTFSKIQQISELRKLKAGTGSHWQDTNVLQANDIPYITSWDYDPMFKMLRANRFDYMIRGAQEIAEEIRLHADLNLVQESHLLIHYRLPVYFFVAKENKPLAERIYKGLCLAQKDGSWEQLFVNTPGYREALTEIRDKNRIRIDLITPPEAVP